MITETPSDYKAPNWKETFKCHDWKTHVPAEISFLWDEFCDSHKAALSEWAQGLADDEERD